MSASQGATVGGYTSALVSSNQVVLYDATGMTHTYTAGNANGSGDGFTPPAGEDSTLIRNPDGSLTCTTQAEPTTNSTPPAIYLCHDAAQMTSTQPPRPTRIRRVPVVRRC